MLSRILRVYLSVLPWIAPSISFSAQQTIQETDLWNFAKQNAVQTLDLRNETQSSTNELAEFKDRFNVSLFGNASYLRTNEEPFIAFQPIISPQSIFEVGARKSFYPGIGVEGAIGIENRTFDVGAGSESPSTGTARLRVTMDLWRNFLGRITKAQKNYLQAEMQQRLLEEKIGVHNYWLQLRSVFWNILILDEQIQIVSKLTELAKNQEKDANQRYREAVADLAEVSFYRAQSASRANDVLTLQFQREQELKKFRSMLPQTELADYTFVPPEAESTRQGVLDCISVIHSFGDVPMKNTFYDELISEVQTYYDSKITEAKAYSDFDVFLNGQIFSRAVDPSAVQAFGEAWSENRQGFQIDLGISIPLGTNKTEKKKIALEKSKAEKEVLELRQAIESNHKFLAESIPLLLSSIENRKQNVEALNTRIKTIGGKYKQGRVSISDYISDQDRLLQSELGLKQTENMIIQTMLQYLGIFSQTPCKFNVVPS